MDIKTGKFETWERVFFVLSVVIGAILGALLVHYRGQSLGQEKVVGIVVGVTLVFSLASSFLVVGCGPWTLYFVAGLLLAGYLFDQSEAWVLPVGITLGFTFMFGAKRLFRPVWKSSDASRRLEAVENVTSQKKLARIARHARHEDVRKKAIAELEDQALLAEIAEGDEFEAEVLEDLVLTAEEDDDAMDVRREAVKKLTDQTLLEGIAQNERLPVGLRLVALETRERNLGRAGQEVLARIAIDYKDTKVCREAAGKLEDQGLLAEVAKNGKDFSVRVTAVWKLEDPGLLADVAKNGEDDVLVIVVEKLEDQGLLAEDQALLADIATRSKNLEVLKAVYERLRDESLRAQIREAWFLPTPTAVHVFYQGSVPNAHWLLGLVDKCRGLLTGDQLLAQTTPMHTDLSGMSRTDFVAEVERRMKQESAKGFLIDILVLDQQDTNDTAAFVVWEGERATRARAML